MDTRTLLAKIVTLIYKTRLIGNFDNDGVVLTALNTIKTDSPEFSFLGKNMVKNVKEMCLTLLNEKEEIPREVISQQLAIVLDNDKKLLDIIKESIYQEQDDSGIKKTVTNLVKNLTAYYKETIAIEAISKVTYELKYNRNKIGNFNQYFADAIAQLAPMADNFSSTKDPAIVAEADFENIESINNVFEDVKSMNSDTGIYRFGFHALNKMLQGGIRRGESMGIEALQHKYKTGTSLTLFSHIATLNSPIMTKEESLSGKKPLLLRITYEDELTNNLQFLYQYLKATEGIYVTKKDYLKLDVKEMSAYITEQLTKTGFSVKMLRIDPSQSSYSHILNIILGYEAQGYAVHVLSVDYLLKAPTTGCIMGVTGSDKRDMLRRVRNFCSARKIAFMSPFQLSSEASRLLKVGVADVDFLNQIAEKNYTDGCQTLGQELDIELYAHIFMHKKKKILAFRRGKHRLPTNISEEDKFCMYAFPELNVPVIEDVNGEDISFKVLPKGGGDPSANSGILEEMLG